MGLLKPETSKYEIKFITMKKIIFPVISIVVILLASCNNDAPYSINQWKKDNVNYFNNMKDSAGFIKDTVATTAGNLTYYYKIITNGNLTGGSPTSTSYVTVNYKGKLINGSVFDKTYKSSNPVNDSTAVPRSFYANQLITGWTANLVQMKVGEFRTVVIPKELGYGIYGMSPSIPPYATLRFDIQLISY